MSQQKHRLVSIMLMLMATTALNASDETAAPDDESADLESRLMAAVAVIKREHFDPPSRQELVHRLMMSVCEELQSPFPRGLKHELSSLDDEADLESHLARTIAAAISERSAESEYLRIQALEYRVLETLLESLPGSNSIRTQKENVVQEQLAGNRYVGIGITLGATGDSSRVGTVFPGGPAHQAGVRAGDLIRKVDSEWVDDIPLAQLVDRLRGPAGSTFALTLDRMDYTQQTLTLTRDIVPFKHVTHDATVITIGRLTSATVQELRDVEAELDDSEGPIILKLEGLGGSNLHHGVLLADALLDGGPIGRVRTQHGVREFTASRECLFRGRRMRVVVSPNTWGAIEWVVAALQDNGRARIAGVQTAGRPFVSELYRVPATDWVLHLTSGVLERADGRHLLGSGNDAELQRLIMQFGLDHPRVLTRLESGGGVIPGIKPFPQGIDELGIFPRRSRERSALRERLLLKEKQLQGIEDSE